MQDLAKTFKQFQQLTDRALLRFLPATDIKPQKLHQAMHYSVFNGGKRFRPILAYSIAKTQQVDYQQVEACACATELIHCYSLIHDDLPAMDDDDLRRGKPTCHIQFDEATAILCGDALQAFAFDILLNHLPDTIPLQNQINIMKTLSYASGSFGMAGGQAIDLESADKAISLQQLEEMHNKKTGALISASIKMACFCCDMQDQQLLQRLEKYAHLLGLNFQITDDILDIESDTLTLGKPQGSDQQANKATFPAILGMAETKRYAQNTHQAILDELEGLNEDYDILRQISEYILTRKH